MSYYNLLTKLYDPSVSDQRYRLFGILGLIEVSVYLLVCIPFAASLIALFSGSSLFNWVVWSYALTVTMICMTFLDGPPALSKFLNKLTRVDEYTQRICKTPVKS